MSECGLIEEFYFLPHDRSHYCSQCCAQEDRKTNKSKLLKKAHENCNNREDKWSGTVPPALDCPTLGSNMLRKQQQICTNVIFLLFLGRITMWNHANLAFTWISNSHVQLFGENSWVFQMVRATGRETIGKISNWDKSNDVNEVWRIVRIMLKGIHTFWLISKCRWRQAGFEWSTNRLVKRLQSCKTSCFQHDDGRIKTLASWRMRLHGESLATSSVDWPLPNVYQWGRFAR